MGNTYTVKQVAQLLGYSTNSIYAFLKEGRIKGVRVGKGRFRVSEEELARVMHLSKRPQSIEAPLVSQPASVIPAARIGTKPDSIDAILSSPAAVTLIGKKWSVPNAFDWLVGLGALLSGLGLFLFNQSYQAPSSAAFAHASEYVRWILISCGIGIMGSSISPRALGWRRFFQIILSAMGLMNATLLYRSSDSIGAVIYGSLAVLVGINAFVVLEGTLSVALYFSALAVLVPVTCYFGPLDIGLHTLLSTFGMTPIVACTIAVTLSVVALSMFWSGYARSTASFWIVCILGAAGLVASSVYAATLVFWSRSFFLLTTALAVGFLPFYKNCGPACSPKQRVLLNGLFVFAGFIMVVAIVVVGLLQQAVWEQNRVEFTNKTTFGQTVLRQALESVEATLLTASKNPEIITAMTEEDAARLEELSKVVYEGNPNLRRLVFVSKDGLGLALYPYGTFDDRNLSFRDYFVQVRDTRNPYVSQLFTALADQAQRKVVSVSVPVESEDREFVGVMLGSLDVFRIGATLQGIAIGSRKEHYIVADSEGKIVMSLDPSEIGAVVPDDDPLRKALRGENGVMIAKLTDGTLGMVAYAPVPPYGWGMSLRAPASRVYTLNQAALSTIFGVVSSIIALSVVWLLLMRVHIRTREPEIGGP